MIENEYYATVECVVRMSADYTPEVNRLLESGELTSKLEVMHYIKSRIIADIVNNPECLKFGYVIK